MRNASRRRPPAARCRPEAASERFASSCRSSGRRQSYREHWQKQTWKRYHLFLLLLPESVYRNRFLTPHRSFWSERMNVLRRTAVAIALIILVWVSVTARRPVHAKGAVAIERMHF